MVVAKLFGRLATSLASLLPQVLLQSLSLRGIPQSLYLGAPE